VRDLDLARRKAASGPRVDHRLAVLLEDGSVRALGTSCPFKTTRTEVPGLSRASGLSSRRPTSNCRSGPDVLSYQVPRTAEPASDDTRAVKAGPGSASATTVAVWFSVTLARSCSLTLIRTSIRSDA
jgi:hypothetical protein